MGMCRISEARRVRRFGRPVVRQSRAVSNEESVQVVVRRRGRVGGVALDVETAEEGARVEVSSLAGLQQRFANRRSGNSPAASAAVASSASVRVPVEEDGEEEKDGEADCN